MTTKTRGSVRLLAAGFALMLSAFGLTATVPASAAPSTLPPLHVTIAMFAFTPSTTNGSLGRAVTWTNEDSVEHTSTSDQLIWNAAPIPTGHTYTHTFISAGTFGYHCAIHPDMRGLVRVPMRISGFLGGGVVTWAVGSGRFDVQIQAPGSTRWTWYRLSTLTRSATFRTSHFGRYLFRARTHGPAGLTGWSPAAALTVR